MLTAPICTNTEAGSNLHLFIFTTPGRFSTTPLYQSATYITILCAKSRDALFSGKKTPSSASHPKHRSVVSSSQRATVSLCMDRAEVRGLSRSA
jgi:hypothetical protein